MNPKHIFIVGLSAWLFVLCLVYAETPDAVTRDDLATRLRAEETVIGLMISIEAVFAGQQTDADGNTYTLFIARNSNTTLLLLLPYTETTKHRELLEGTILHVELQEQDIRDHRIYAIWIDDREPDTFATSLSGLRIGTPKTAIPLLQINTL